MKKLALAAITLSVAAIAPTASAQNCLPGSWLCASASVTVGGSVNVTTVAPQPYATPVYQQPVYQQPVVVQTPQIYYTQPRVVVTPAPPMRYYVTQRTQYMVEPGSMYFLRPNFLVGGGVSVGGAYFGGRDASRPGVMGLVAAMARVRGAGHVGAELSIGGAFGSDWNGDTRFEIPVSLSGIAYFNPQHRAQIYAIAGVNGSLAGVEYSAANRRAGSHGGLNSGEYLYVGGHAGAGVEFQLSRHFVIFADARAFVRTRIDESTRSNPEFAENNGDGTTRTTNTSVGVVSQLGAIFYY
ncbi:MAG: hypothetical protein Q8Q09_03035 [Deltaproteobacteria bacterium]|nr:hypothetical protein [Deltaproteobacteria bacterium]